MVAPVVIFVYARPEHTVKTIESLANNLLAKETEVYIFSDAAKNRKVQYQVEQVREYIDTLAQRHMFKTLTISKAEVNKGLAESVISGVTEVIAQHGKVIVVEDDLVSAPDFLNFMNDALDFFHDDEKIWSICGYTFKISLPAYYTQDIYLSYRGGSWGWATWKNRWEIVDWEVADYPLFKNNKASRARFNRGGRDMADMLDLQMQGEIDSWAIRWCYAQSKLDMLTVYPVVSRIRNIGLDGTGTHSGITSKYDSVLSTGTDEYSMEKISLDKRIVKSFRNQYGTGFEYLIIEIKRFLKKLLRI